MSYRYRYSCNSVTKTNTSAFINIINITEQQSWEHKQNVFHIFSHLAKWMFENEDAGRFWMKQQRVKVDLKVILTWGPVWICGWEHRKPVRLWMRWSCWLYPHLCSHHTGLYTTAAAPWWPPSSYPTTAARPLSPLPSLSFSLSVLWGHA